MVGTVGNTEGKVQKEENSFEVLLNMFIDDLCLQKTEYLL